LYGGFWRRVAAYVIDSFILTAGMFLLVFVYSIAIAMVAGARAGADSSNAMPAVAAVAGAGVIYLVGLAGTWLYYALFESSSLQGTPGKRAVDLRVATAEGARVGFGRATGRYFGKFISSLILGIGYVMVAFTERRQGLHDMMAGTVLVRNSLVSEGLKAIPASEVRSPGLGGAAIAAIAIIGGLIPVTGIIAAIAIPAYADYTIRAQVTEGLMAVADYKVRVVELLGSGTGADGLDNSAVNLPPTSPQLKFVESIDVVNGAIVVTYGRAASPIKLSGKRLMLMPGTTAEGDIVWTCGYAQPPFGVKLLHDDYAGYNTIAPKYLPSACRN
jgi:uncharacterized RDD family membrane protein YckC/Tfp pilus assembly major pilin PilA